MAYKAMRVREAIPTNEVLWRVPYCKRLDAVVLDGVDDAWSWLFRLW